MRKPEIAEFPEADRAEGCLHPRDQFTLLGHQEAESIFLRAMESGRQHHAWLITGAKGIGKATLAYRMMRYLLGAGQLLDGGLDFPSDDPIAQRISAQGHGNVYVLKRPYDHKTKKIKSEIPVAEARAMKEFLTQMPSEKGWRVVLIDSMDEMNRNAENAILKSLEEPPEKTMFFLLSSRPGLLLPTIRSRCVSLRLSPVLLDEISAWLSRQTDHSPDIIDAAVKLSRGAPGRAFTLAETADDVLIPLSKFIASLTKPADRVDLKISQSLSKVSSVDARALFWGCLMDILKAQAVFTQTGEWDSAFKPFPVSKDARKWLDLSARMRQLSAQQKGLNMEPTSVMMTALSEIRAA